MQNDFMQFENDCKNEIEQMRNDKILYEKTMDFINHSTHYKYSYHFKWMGVPIMQYPQDIIAMQELIWKIKPELIIETGVARGGSVIFYSSMIELLGNNGKVIGIDIDIRKHNREVIEKHAMCKNIKLIEGSSIDETIVNQIKLYIKEHEIKNILVILDSCHTFEHVLKEMKIYSQFVSLNSYLVVFDTVVEYLTNDNIFNRPWGPGNNPKTAVDRFLQNNDNFEIDKQLESKLLITVAPGGYLKCKKKKE